MGTWLSRAAAAMVLVLAMAAAVALAAGAAETEAPPAANLHPRIVAAYLANDFAALEAALKAPAADLERLSAPEQADVQYVRAALAECRPAWWRTARTAKRANFAAMIWKQRVAGTVVQGDHANFQLRPAGPVSTLLVTCDLAHLDDAGPSEPPVDGRGFTAGDRAEVDLWQLIGNGAALLRLPGRALVAWHQRDAARLQQYHTLRGYLAALGVCSPRARRACLVLQLAGYADKYGGGSRAPCRRAIASMFIAEVLADPARWPSVPLPQGLPPESPEENFAVHLMGQFGADWTLAEDMALRAAAARWAEANDKDVLEQGKVVLPNKLVVMFDPKADEPRARERDAWVAARLAEAASRRPAAK